MGGVVEPQKGLVGCSWAAMGGSAAAMRPAFMAPSESFAPNWQHHPIACSKKSQGPAMDDAGLLSFANRHRLPRRQLKADGSTDSNDYRRSRR